MASSGAIWQRTTDWVDRSSAAHLGATQRRNGDLDAFFQRRGSLLQLALPPGLRRPRQQRRPRRRCGLIHRAFNAHPAPEFRGRAIHLRAAFASHPFPDAGSAPRAEDLISAVQFDDTGDYLATGDRGGRVVIFESSEVTHRQAQVRLAERSAAPLCVRGCPPVERRTQGAALAVGCCCLGPHCP